MKKEYTNLVCIWKSYVGENKREIETEYQCHKCRGYEADCHAYKAEKIYIKEVSKKLLEGRLL